jgi:hypothetical protein
MNYLCGLLFGRFFVTSAYCVIRHWADNLVLYKDN